MDNHKFISANTILYCRHWEETVGFYRDGLSLTINFKTDWFVEFLISDNARISFADQKKRQLRCQALMGLPFPCRSKIFSLHGTNLQIKV